MVTMSEERIGITKHECTVGKHECSVGDPCEVHNCTPKICYCLDGEEL